MGPRNEILEMDQRSANEHLAVDDAIGQIQRLMKDAPGSRCYVLVDPTLRNCFAALQSRAANFGNEIGVVPIRIAPGRVDKTHWPFLVELDPVEFGAREVLAASLMMSLDDWEWTSLRAANGHRIGGYIVSSMPPESLAMHLAVCFVRRGDLGQQVLVRFYDPSVFSLAWQILTKVQRRALLALSDGWFVMQREGRLICHAVAESIAAEDVDVSLNFDEKQWARLRNIGALNRACARVAEAPSRELMSAAALALARANGYGFFDESDLIEFAWRALTVSPQFDLHPVVTRCIKSGEPGDTFGYVAADLTEEDWIAIGMELRKETI